MGKGLHSAGYRVRIATHQEFESLICSHDLDFSPIEGNPKEILEGEVGQQWLASGGSPLKFFRFFAEASRPLIAKAFEGCWKACQAMDGILFSTAGWLVATHIVEKTGLPAIATYYGPLSPTSAFSSTDMVIDSHFGPANLATHWINGSIMWYFFRDVLNQARREVLGLHPMPRENPWWRMFKEKQAVLYGFSPSFIPKPKDWGDWINITGYWFLDRPADWNPSDELLEFLSSGSKPVYIGFGSMNQSNSGELTNIVVKALQMSGQRGILATGWGGLGESDDLPESIFPIKTVPHDWLFPQMAAVIHHGGAGTTGASLRAGIPTIIVPFFGDQSFWGLRVYKSGVGPKPVPRQQLTSQLLADAIQRAIKDDNMQQKARQLGKNIMAENGVARAVEMIKKQWPL